MRSIGGCAVSYRIILCQLPLLLIALGALGQESQPSTSAVVVAAKPKEDLKPPIPQPLVDEFRDLICSRVANINDPNHDFALEIAIEHGFKDDRFNAGLFIAMREFCKPGQWNSKECLRVIKMFPLCDFKPEVKSRMLVEAYVAAHKHSRERRSSTDRRAISAISSLMDNCKNDVGDLVRKQIESGDFEAQVIDLFAYIQGDTNDLIPQLLESARSEDPEMSLATMNLLSSLMHQGNEEPIPLSIDPRYASYADRIMERYDRNNDRVLTPDEYQGSTNMSAYDLNADRKVTYMECVQFIQSRINPIIEARVNAR